MGIIAEMAEKFWTGEISPLQQHPFTPLMAREEVAPGIAFVSSFANTIAVKNADESLLLVDTGSPQFAGQIFGSVRAWSSAPVKTAIYTHGHLDHVSGTGLFDREATERGWARPHVVAHEAVPARFERYRMTAGYNSCINSRQFSVKIAWPTEWRAPDELYAKAMTVDGVELHHARGETDDHTWVWMPSVKVLCTGDLFIWAVPNAGNPQKVQRYPRQWAEALRTMAALEAELMLPGHGVPIVGAERVKTALTETAELLECLVDGVVAMMNEGAPLEAILRAVKMPERLAGGLIQPIYDEPEFIVRNVWRLYGGWWDGDPAALKPAEAGVIAREVAELAGGAAALMKRAEERAAAGELAMACQLAEWAARVAVGDEGLREARAKIYRARAEAETSLMARGIFRDAAERS